MIRITIQITDPETADAYRGASPEIIANELRHELLWADFKVVGVEDGEPWKDPESAPYDELVLVVVAGRHLIGMRKSWQGPVGCGPIGWCHPEAMGRMNEVNRGVTHWMPLPKPPIP